MFLSKLKCARYKGAQKGGNKAAEAASIRQELRYSYIAGTHLYNSIDQ